MYILQWALRIVKHQTIEYNKHVYFVGPNLVSFEESTCILFSDVCRIPKLKIVFIYFVVYYNMYRYVFSFFSVNAQTYCFLLNSYIFHDAINNPYSMYILHIFI